MAVSNPATMSSVYAEFGAPAGTPLSQFLRGGAYVPNVAANNNVPTALPIKLSQLAGAVKYVNVSASANPTTVTGTGSHTSEPIIGPQTNVTASGGNGSYTFTWAYVSGDSTHISLNANSPSGNTDIATWKISGAVAGSYSAVWKCTVSDGTSSASPTVTVNFTVT